MSEPLNIGANEGESERRPEALIEQQVSSAGRADNRRWRYAVRDVSRLPFTGAGVWRPIGPAPLRINGDQRFHGIGPVSGEVVDIAIDPRAGDERALYAAAGNGGLWKSTDGGQSWRSVTDQLPSTAIGAVAVDPQNPDTVYLGTGNAFPGSSGIGQAVGLYKSVDGGRSWSRLDTPAGRPPQPITQAVNVTGGVRVTVPGHGYITRDRVVAVGLPGMAGSLGERRVQRIDADHLRLDEAHLSVNGTFTGTVDTRLLDARQAPFLSDDAIIRMVCPATDVLLVATISALYFSNDGGQSFGANHPTYDDGLPVHRGLISALEVDQGWTRALRVADATPATPIAVTLPGHGFVTGDRVVLGGVGNNREANGAWTVDVVDDDHVTLRGSSGNGTGATTGFALGPTHPLTRPVTGATNPSAPNDVVLSCAAHGWITGDVVAVSDIRGNTAANGSWAIRVLTPDTFTLVGARGNAAYTGGGIVDGPRHGAPKPITAADTTHGLVVTVAGHGLLDGDRATVLGLPGINAPGNSTSVQRVDDNQVRLSGLTMHGVYGGVGATLVGPPQAYNTVYFAASGRIVNQTDLNPDRGLFRLAIASTGELVTSANLLRNAGGPAAVHGRVAICQSLFPNTTTLYAAVQDRESGNELFLGLFRSHDFGGSWALRDGLNHLVGIDGTEQSAYDLVVGVDPQDPERVYAAQQQLWRSLTGGRTWPVATAATAGGMNVLDVQTGRAHSLTLLHWDHHELVFPPPTWWAYDAGSQPVRPTPAYHGTDGGIAVSGGSGNGPMTFADLNRGIATNLLNSLDIGRGAANNAVTFAGMQDTGTAGHGRDEVPRSWSAGIDGDGGPVAVDPFDPDIVFGFDGDSFMRTTNGGRTWFMANDAADERVLQVDLVENTNPVRVTTSGHSYRTGYQVHISNVRGGGGLANGLSTITVQDQDTRTFTLNNKNGQNAAAFGPFPEVRGRRYLAEHAVTAATLEQPIQIETATPHGCATGQRVCIEDVEGNLAANNTAGKPSWEVTVISPTRLSLDLSDGTLAGHYVRGTGVLRGPAVADPVPIFAATNAQPVVITARGHGFRTGELVTVTDLPPGAGNNVPLANVVDRQITVLDTNSFALDGLQGNALGRFPRVLGLSVGRKLPPVTDDTRIVRVALVPGAGAPASKVFVSMDRQLFLSRNGGLSFVPMATFADFITAVHAPADGRLWVATGDIDHLRSFRVRFSIDDGAHFLGSSAPANFASDVGARSFISQVVEDPQVPNGQHVAVVCAGYTGTATSRRTRHVFETTNQGRTTGGAAAWSELGGVFDAALGNLPDIPVHGAAWDTSANPSRLLLVTDNGVLRHDRANSRWERLGPNLPFAVSTAMATDIATDMGVARSVIRVATYGRSAWEFHVPGGPSLHVEGDLGFGHQQVGTTVRRRLTLHSVGDADLHVASLDGATAELTVESVPPGATFPLTLQPGQRQAFDVVFAPTAAADRGTTFLIASDDPEHSLVEMRSTGRGVAAGRPRLAARAFLEFGRVRTGAPSNLTLELRNIGNAPMRVTGLDLVSANSPFTMPGAPAVPLTIAPGTSVDITVRFAPADNSETRATLVVTGDGGVGQAVTLLGQGSTTGAGLLALLLEQLGIAERTEELV